MADDREEGGVDATPEGAARAGQRPKPRREGLASRAQRVEKALADFAKNLMRDYLGGEPRSSSPLIEVNRRAYDALRQAPTVINPERPRPPSTIGDARMRRSIERYKNPERSDDYTKTMPPDYPYKIGRGGYNIFSNTPEYRASERRGFVEDQRTNYRSKAYNELLRAARETLARPMPSPTHDRDSPDPEVVRDGMRT